MNKKSRGRPERSPITLQRIKLWVEGVCVAAERAPNDLSDSLGPDGVWNGMWSRYSRGIVAPTQQKLERIDAVFPGSARYYSSPLWALAEDREFSWNDLRIMAEWLRKLFRDAILGDTRRSYAFGKFWLNPSDSYEMLDKAGLLINDQKFGLDALTVILFILRQAELLQNGDLYLYTMRTLAIAERGKEGHLVLRVLPRRFFTQLIEPLRKIQFADPKMDDLWSQVLQHHYDVNSTSRNSCDLLDVMRTFPYIALDEDVDSDGD